MSWPSRCHSLSSFRLYGPGQSHSVTSRWSSPAPPASIPTSSWAAPPRCKRCVSLERLSRRRGFFSRNRGRALLVRKGNPLGIRALADIARTGARVAQADSVEAGARAGNRAAVEALIGKPAADAFFANEVEHFPGRLGVTHRDVPEMIACGYAEVGLTQYHLISYWVRTFPNHFELVPIEGAERFSVKIAFG